MMAFARWNLACCELLGWKETARHLNPMLSGSVMMFWERTCSKLPICLNFCGTAFLQQQPESYCEACLLTLYRVYSRASPCVAYGVWSLNLFIFPTSIFFKKKKKISAEQPCSSSSFAPYPHLISPPLVCSNRCRNKENLLLFSLPKGQIWGACLPTSFSHHAELQGSPQCLALLTWEV